jgi:proteic killer suppression protein
MIRSAGLEMIRNFRDAATESVFHGECPKGFPASIVNVARRKLRMLDAARALKDLAVPPNNRLHALRHDRAGQHAIRINDQYRICFVWKDGDAHDVEIIDYH